MVQKEDIQKSLQNIIDNIGEFKSGDIDWYGKQVLIEEEDYEEYGDDDDDYRSTDEFLMCEAFEYPDLHPLMREVAKVITETNINKGEVWDQDEEHAGTNAALILALNNKEDILLYSDFIATNDLNHPVYQDEDWDEVFDEWGPCEETLRLLLTIELRPGQRFVTSGYWEDFIRFLKKGDNINLFFKQLHLFILWAKNKGLYLRKAGDFLEDKLPEVLPNKIAANKELVNYVKTQFMDYPEVPEPPTLEMLMEGYRK